MSRHRPCRVRLLAATSAAAVAWTLLAGPAAVAQAPAAGPADDGAPADADDPFARTVEVDGITVRTTIRATSYAWTITNATGTPVRRVSLAVDRNTAGIIPPEGWTYEVVDGVLTLTADRAGLGLGRSMTLVAQAPFDQIRVRRGSMEVERLGGDVTTIDGVWLQGPRRRTMWWVTAGGITAIAAVHLGLAARRRRRASGQDD